ncbi:hypothetical protein Vafri_12906, partial [Volvox africanus]
ADDAQLQPGEDPGDPGPENSPELEPVNRAPNWTCGHQLGSHARQSNTGGGFSTPLLRPFTQEHSTRSSKETNIRQPKAWEASYRSCNSTTHTDRGIGEAAKSGQQEANLAADLDVGLIVTTAYLSEWESPLEHWASDTKSIFQILPCSQSLHDDLAADGSSPALNHWSRPF